MKRIVPVTAYKQLTRVRDIKAADLISGVTVRSERNSATDYIASLDFSFQADAVRAALSRQSIPFIDEQAPTISLLGAAARRSTNRNERYGPVRRAWTGLDLQHTITPVAVQDLKPEIHADTVSMLLAGDGNGLRILNDEYGTKLIVMAVAEPDMVAKKLTVTLAGQDAVGPLLLKRTYRMTSGDLAHIRTRGRHRARSARRPLEGRQNQRPANRRRPVHPSGRPTNGRGEEVKFTASFVNPRQWNEIRAQLLDTPGVDALEISTASDRDAAVSLRISGGQEASPTRWVPGLTSLLTTPDGWVLRPNY